MSASEGAYLVDLYNAFGGVASTDLIGVDGLHPTAAGYQRMADTFYAEIRNRLELR
jgi:lysophospholipase L1-like esterase